MFRVLPLLIFLRLQAESAQSTDGRLNRLTVSPEVDVATLMTANPLLRKLPMFANTPPPTRRFSPPPPPPVDRKAFPNVGDNFDALYRQINETFFGMAVREKHQIPTGRALSDDNLPEQTANEIEQRMMEEEPPFAVTESLLDAMTPKPEPWDVEPPPEVRSWTETPPTTRTFSPAAERLNIEALTTSTEEPSTTPRGVERTDTQLKNLVNKGLPGLAPLRRASDWQVQRNDNGRYLVSGTRFYQDNRIDGGITGLSEEYQPSGNRWELNHIQNDPRYVIEAELTKIRAHAAALKKTGRPLSFGTKTHEVPSKTKGDGLKFGKVMKITPEKRWPSKVKMVEEDGKMFERRKISEAGEMIEVANSNRHLFGHDIYTYPGAVIHGPLLRNVRLRQNISKCFDSRPSTTLTGVVPFDRRIGNSPIQCLRVCAMSPLCRSVVYDEILSICDVFSEKPGVSSAITRTSTSSTLFEPSVEDPESCLRSTRAKLHAAVVAIPTKNPIDPQSEVTFQLSTEELQIVDRDAGRCETGEEQLFARLEGVRVGGQRREKAFVTNEDDCVFACLTDSEMEKRGLCGAVGYTHTTQECTLYNSLPDELTVHEATTLYHKICVTASTSRLCSGATIEHVRQAVLGRDSMREAKMVESRAQCIAECLQAARKSGYMCLSVTFYPKEKTSCILHDASVVTAPDSLVIEAKREVDYYGVDECYGLEDVTHRKESNLLVEDDVKAGQITHGSRVEALN